MVMITQPAVDLWLTNKDFEAFESTWEGEKFLSLLAIWVSENHVEVRYISKEDGRKFIFQSDHDREEFLALIRKGKKYLGIK